MEVSGACVPLACFVHGVYEQVMEELEAGEVLIKVDWLLESCVLERSKVI